MCKTTVVNRATDEFDVYIGRGSKWGNPFVIGMSGTRKQVIDMYKEYILSRKDLLEDIEELRGQRLGCYCKPLACHGDVLVELLNDNNK